MVNTDESILEEEMKQTNEKYERLQLTPPSSPDKYLYIH